MKTAPTILLEVGPLAISPAKGEDGGDRAGLYVILVKAHLVKIGPYYANLSKAHDAARKILKRYPAAMWDQPVAWLSRQTEMLAWIHTEIGRSEDLVDGQWVDAEGKTILGPWLNG